MLNEQYVGGVGGERSRRKKKIKEK